MSIRHYSSDDPTSFKHEGEVEQPGDWSVGRVFKSKQKSDGKEVLINAVQINNESALGLLRSEIENLRVLNSEFNVLWHEDIAVNLQTHTLQIFMDYFPLGDLDAFIKAHPYGKNRIPKASIGQIMSGLSWGLLDCHSKGILHGDIKPQNIQLQAGKYQEFDLILGRLSNFCINSLSEIKNLREEKERDSPRINGTISYLAPECLVANSPTYTAKSDVFALGCVFWELACKTKAWQGTERHILAMPQWAVAHLGSTLAPLPGKMMHFNPELRPDSAWFAKTMREYSASRVQKARAGTGLDEEGKKDNAVVQHVDLPTQVLPPPRAASKDLTSKVGQTQSLSPEAKGAGLKAVVTIASALHPAFAPLGSMINAAVDQKAAARRAAAATAPPAQALPPALPPRGPPSQNQKTLADQSRSLLQSESRPSPNPEYQQVETTGSVNISLSTVLQQALYTTAIQSLIQSGTAEPKVPALSLNLAQELLQVLPPVQTEAQRRQSLTLQPLSRSVSNSLPPPNEPSGTSAPQLAVSAPAKPSFAEQLLTALPAAMPAIAHYGATHHGGHHAHHTPQVPAPQSHHHLFNHAHNQHKAAQPAASASGLEPDPNDPVVQTRFQQALALQNQQFAMTRSIIAGQNTQFAAMGQMNIDNFNTMNQINAGYAAQAQDQLQDRMQTRAMNDANKHLNAQAFSANIQGDDWALFPAEQTTVKFS